MKGTHSHSVISVRSHRDLLSHPPTMFLLFCAFVALAKATPQYESPYYVSTGNSQQYRTQDETGNYRFGYDESHPSGGTFRDETGDAWGNKWGSYGLREADGRYRVVNYVADSQGFRAEIKSNEPGLAPQKTVAQKPLSQEPLSQEPVVQEPVVQEPIVQEPVVQEPVRIKKPVLYAAPAAPAAPVTIHHSYNPEYPLLYHHSPYHTVQHPYYVSYGNYGNYKGTPFRRFSPYYKGTPFVSKTAPVVTRHGYYVYP